MAGGFWRWAVGLFCWVLFISRVLGERNLEGTIVFSTFGRLRFAFDIFCVNVPSKWSSFENHGAETRLTYGDGQIVNYNGFFASNSEQDLIFKASKEKQNHATISYGASQGRNALEGKILAYVSERQGRPQVYFNLYTSKVERGVPNLKVEEGGSITHSQASVVIEHKIETVELHTSDADAVHDDHHNIADDNDDEKQQVFFQDRPSIAQGCVIYISSQERAPSLRQSWTAVYSTNLTTGFTTRLTPAGVADYSPSVSPSGKWVLVASYGKRSWQGEMYELKTDLYIFNAKDGSGRKLLVKGAGWPSWVDDSTFFFHRKAEDGWWSIYKGTILALHWMALAENAEMEDLVTVERVTPAGIHCFTPAASSTMKWVAVATRRPESVFRHIEIYDLQSNSFFQVTNHTAPRTHHYNPFVAYDSTLVGYHKCRGGVAQDQRLSSMYGDIPGFILKREIIQEAENGAKKNDQSLTVPHLDYVRSRSPQLSLLRTDGEFPSFSPDGSLIAYIRKAGESGIRVMRSDGSGSKEVYSEHAFGTVWDRTREGVIYTSSGPIFSKRSTVHIVAIFNAHRLVNGEDVPLVSKILTKKGSKNNAFPWPSPDGNYLVFRSSRTGWKNLYIMDAVQGEEGGLWRLTDGKWTDTMCSWSPDGQWIAFSSDRDNPGGGSFALYLIHPNGTGLHKVFNHTSQVGGRVNHASFSPDSKTLLFTTDYAGLSAEPIAVPFQFQPYGEIFLASLDGMHLERLTHLQYENGTPSWGIKFIGPSDLSKEGEGLQCLYNDVDWLTDGIRTKLQTPYGLPTQVLCSNAG